VSVTSVDYFELMKVNEDFSSSSLTNGRCDFCLSTVDSASPTKIRYI
jgi:hypothetical protein